jgi:stage II sporulation protein D
VQVRVVGDIVQFWDGRGFGHGVGMCQWGAQAMAQQGYDHQQILAFYYPGAVIAKTY